MHNLIDWYIVELRLRLNTALTADRIDEIAKEAELHLRESVNHRTGPGVSVESATEAAIAAYGSPDKVARGFLRGQRLKLFSLNPTLWTLLGVFIAIYCWCFHWLTLGGIFDNFGATWQNGLAGIFGFGALALIALSARARLKSNWVAVVAGTVVAAGASVPLVSAWVIPDAGQFQGISRLHLKRDAATVASTLEKLRVYDAFMERGVKAFAAAKSPDQLPDDMRDAKVAATEFGVAALDPSIELHPVNPLLAESDIALNRGGAYPVPRSYGIFAMVDGRIWAVDATARFEDAKRIWSTTGSAACKSTRFQIQNFEVLLANAREAEAGRIFFPVPYLWQETVIGSIMLLPLLLLVDGVAAFTAKPRRRWPNRVLA